ncbi:MAG: ABC transporter ATP-binding protein [Bacilli bacterium]
MPVISIINLSKSYKNHQIINKINLSINSPGIWALVGPNGVGKTTLLNLIANIIIPDSGTIEVVGQCNKQHSVFKEVSYFQDNTVLFDYLTGYDHLKFVCDVYQLSKENIAKISAYVGMESYLNKEVGKYSLGMKQHLLLALSIINQPKLLLLDEPLNGLDPTSAILMRTIFNDLVQKGTTIILSSHNLAEIDRLTKNILFLKSGQLIEIDISHHEVTFYYFQLSDNSKAQDLIEENGIQVEYSNERLKVQLSSTELSETIQLFLNNGLRIYDIEKEVTGSEQLYVELFETKGR